MALKIAALALLWWLFFSPGHRLAVDAQAASLRFGVAPALGAGAADGEHTHD